MSIMNGLYTIGNAEWKYVNLVFMSFTLEGFFVSRYFTNDYMTYHLYGIILYIYYTTPTHALRKCIFHITCADIGKLTIWGFHWYMVMLRNIWGEKSWYPCHGQSVTLSTNKWIQHLNGSMWASKTSFKSLSNTHQCQLHNVQIHSGT